MGCVYEFMYYFLKECVIETLQDMFGRDSVPKTFKGDTVAVVVDGKTAKIDFSTLVSLCISLLKFWRHVLVSA